MERSEMIEYLRTQAYWANCIADMLERGENPKDFLWCTDLDTKLDAEVRKEREIA